MFFYSVMVNNIPPILIKNEQPHKIQRVIRGSNLTKDRQYKAKIKGQKRRTIQGQNKRTKTQTMIHKILHRKLKTKQQ